MLVGLWKCPVKDFVPRSSLQGYNWPMKMTTVQLASDIGSILKNQGASVTCAESCTGGGVAQALTEVAGSSAWFGFGFVTYANRAKMDLLGVSEQTLDDWGAVSSQVVEQMAAGARRVSGAEYAIATSGIAGPDGGSEDKPVGTVWIAVAGPDSLESCCYHYPGNRSAVRSQAVEQSLQMLWQLLQAAS